MTKIFSTNNQYEILIDDKFVIVDDTDFISIQFPNGFYWTHHAQTCSDCKEFLDTIGSDRLKWLIETDNQTYLLGLSSLGGKNDHFTNLVQTEINNNFSGTNLRFLKKKIEKSELDNLLKDNLERENYEVCADLRDLSEFLKNKGK